MFDCKNIGMSWVKSPCRIEKRENLESRMVVKIEGFFSENYHPFDLYNKEQSESLYLTFANIREDNEEEILNFINNFGFLGMNIQNKDEYSFFDTIEVKKINQEPINSIIKEIKIMKSILKLLDALKNNSYEDMLEETKYLYTTKMSQVKIDSVLNSSQIELPARIIISKTINDQLLQVNPALDVSISLKSNEITPFSFVNKWQPKSLLACMYTMLYMDILKGNIYRKCKNEMCLKYFPVSSNDDKKLYCDNNCARAQAQRDYRRRKKLEGNDQNGK